MYSYPGTTLKIYLKTQGGLFLYGTVDSGTPPTTAGIFAVGCEIIDLSSGIKYRNAGTTASPSWQNADEITTGEIANGAVTGAKLVTVFGMATISRQTNGTTPVNVFGATVPFSGTIDGIFVVSKDTTAGNISILNNGNTVATIAKDTTAGVLTGATSLANTSVVAGTPFTIVSDSTGNVFVYITFRFN